MRKSIQFILFISTITLFSCTSKKEGTTTIQNDATEEVPRVEVQDLTAYGIANFANNVLGGLEVGDIAPDFKLHDENDKLVSLKETLKDGPVLLVFYRADWCPYCTKHLAEFQEGINDIKAKGVANVIAISPQMPKYSKALSEENGYTFPILYDKDHMVMKDYKVFFSVTEEYNEKIFKYKGEYIQTRNGDTHPYLPVPATYMIGQDQKIKFVHYDPNYRERANVDEALNSIE